MNEKKQHHLSVVIDEETYQALQERISYLQARRPGSKVTTSDAVRHALIHTAYKRHGKKKDEDTIED